MGKTAKERWEKWHAGKVARNECVNCAKPPMPGKVRCEEHLVEQKVRQFERTQGMYRARKAARLCVRCAKPSRRTECPKCREVARKRLAEVRARRVESGLCRQCGKPAGGHYRCARCRKQALGYVAKPRKAKPVFRVWTEAEHDRAQLEYRLAMEAR